MQVGVRPPQNRRARPRGGHPRPPSGVFPVPRGPGGDATGDDGGSPLIRVRDLKVWFHLRRSLLRELTGRSSLWVRAVDGVSFDVKRGEVFCLVGESGCGKTTTGKALLRLVDATEGDVFFEIPTDEYRKYEALRSAGGPDAAAQIDALRRKYSFSWKEQLPWDTRQILIWFGAVAAAFILGVGLSVFAAAVIPGALVDSGFILGASLLCGLLIGVIASLPPTRPSARTPAILALLAILAFNLIPIVAALGWPSSLPNPPSDPLGIWAAVWGAASFGGCRAEPGAGVRLPLPAGAERRPTPAGLDRGGVGPRARLHRRGRAGLDARRVDPDRDPSAHDGPQGETRLDVPLHHARPEPRMDLGRSDRGHVSRQDRRGRDRRAGHLPSEASVHPGPHLGRPESRSEASREAHDPEGRTAGRREHPERMPLSSPLPPRVREVRMERRRDRGRTHGSLGRRTLAGIRRNPTARPGDRLARNGSGHVSGNGRRNAPSGRVREPEFAARPEGNRGCPGDRRCRPRHAA